MEEPNKEQEITDWGHRTDVDATQIQSRLTMTPLERLRIHEKWRLGVRNLQQNARILRRTDPRNSH